MRILGALSSCAAVAVALLLCAFPAFAVDPIIMVYRADTRPPEEIFVRGFNGRGQRMDILAHTLGGACDETDPRLASMWVSTSSEYNEALEFARSRLYDLPSGIQNHMWLYFIRPDDTYLNVPALVGHIADEARAGRSGYTPEQARTLDYLLRNTLVSSEAEVVTHYVAPANIAFARQVYFDADDEMQIGPLVANTARYRDLPTSASNWVADLQAFLPASSIRVGLVDDDGPNSGSDSDQCFMTCDGARAAESRNAYASAPAAVCGLSKRATPAVLDVILGY